MRILYFAIQDQNYPRNRLIRQALGDNHSARIEIVPVDHTRGFVRNLWRLGQAVRRNDFKCDAVVLAEFSLQYAILAWILTRRCQATLVIDWFVGLYETRVEDYDLTSRWSLRGALYWLSDRLAVRLADVLLTDTTVRASMLQSKYGATEPPIVIPVGAPDWAVYHDVAGFKAGKSTIRVLYYGNYIPLHGLDKVMSALESSKDPLPIELTLVGDGFDRSRIETLALSYSNSFRSAFHPPVKENELAELIAQHDIILGVFGDSTKARSVVANKVWQGLACGKIVVTQYSEALAEIGEKLPCLLVQSEGNSRASVLDAMCEAVQRVDMYVGPRRAAAEILRRMTLTGVEELWAEIQSRSS